MAHGLMQGWQDPSIPPSGRSALLLCNRRSSFEETSCQLSPEPPPDPEPSLQLFGHRVFPFAPEVCGNQRCAWPGTPLREATGACSLCTTTAREMSALRAHAQTCRHMLAYSQLVQPDVCPPHQTTWGSHSLAAHIAVQLATCATASSIAEPCRATGLDNDANLQNLDKTSSCGIGSGCWIWTPCHCRTSLDETQALHDATSGRYSAVRIEIATRPSHAGMSSCGGPSAVDSLLTCCVRIIDCGEAYRISRSAYSQHWVSLRGPSDTAEQGPEAHPGTAYSLRVSPIQRG